MQFTEEQQREVQIGQLLHAYYKGDLNQTQAAHKLSVSQKTFSNMVQKYAHKHGLERTRRYDLAKYLHGQFEFVAQVLAPYGAPPLAGIPIVGYKDPWPTEGNVWFCPSFWLPLAPSHFGIARRAIANGSSVVMVRPVNWENSWALLGVTGTLTPTGHYHLRHYAQPRTPGKPASLRRYRGELRVLVLRPGSQTRYTNTI